MVSIIILIHPYYVARSVDSVGEINHSGYKVRVRPEIKALFVFLSFQVKPSASPGSELWRKFYINSSVLFTCVESQTHQEKNRRQEEHGAARHLHPLRLESSTYFLGLAVAAVTIDPPAYPSTARPTPAAAREKSARRSP